MPCGLATSAAICDDSYGSSSSSFVFRKYCSFRIWCTLLNVSKTSSRVSSLQSSPMPVSSLRMTGKCAAVPASVTYESPIWNILLFSSYAYDRRVSPKVTSESQAIAISLFFLTTTQVVMRDSLQQRLAQIAQHFAQIGDEARSL